MHTIDKVDNFMQAECWSHIDLQPIKLTWYHYFQIVDLLNDLYSVVDDTMEKFEVYKVRGVIQITGRGLYYCSGMYTCTNMEVLSLFLNPEQC